MSDLPIEKDRRLDYLRLAAERGTALQKKIKIGKSSRKLNKFLKANAEFMTVRDGSQLIIRYDDFIYWNVTLSEDDLVLGYSASGYGDLIQALGVDFAGNDIVGLN